MEKSTIFIAGSGGIGRAAALIALESPHIDAQVILGDVNQESLEEARAWIQHGTTGDLKVETLLMNSDEQKCASIYDRSDVLLDCSPGKFAPDMARLCLKHEMHYANLTEYVDETNQVMEMAKDAKTGFILQTGLAPGYINVLGVALYDKFKKLYNSDKLKSLRLRVGALSENTRSPHFYAFTWSPVGVATEYVKESVVVRDGQRLTLPSLSGREQLILNGNEYEADYTSGGVSDLPEALGDKIPNIDYKTIRYPGHYDWVIDSLTNFGDDRIQQLEDFMLENIPRIESDVVIVYAEIQGLDNNGALRCIDELKVIKPQMVGNQMLKAIQTTTAAPLVECARRLINGEHSGTVTQSMFDARDFLSSPVITDVYGE